jgi:biopolymer transport protein TolR
MPDADKEDAIVVAITRDGGVFLGQNKDIRQRAWRQVREKLADKPGKTIYVRADARAQYRAVEDAIDAVRTAGVEDVGLLTQKRKAILQAAVNRLALSFNDFEQTRSFKPCQ